MSNNLRNLKELRSFLSGELKKIYRPKEINALADILIKTITGSKKLHEIYDPERPVTKYESARIRGICSELLTGKPIQYILGETSFYNCTINLNNSTLIPRQETEELVDLIIRENTGFNGNILDFGCGSGCISIAIASNIPGARVKGTDISDDAVAIARKNAIINKVDVSFIRSDIFNPDPGLLGSAGIIVSNPPYVRESEKKLMSRNVIDFEPHLALFVPDSDPLKYYRAIIQAADKLLVPPGKIYFEINEAMGSSMTLLLESSGYKNVEVIKDLNGRDRITKGIKYV